jgi:magnesium transporter
MRSTVQSEEFLKRRLLEITQLLERHRVLESLASRQEGPRRDLIEQLQHRQNLAELHKHLRTMHAADIAYVLEALSPDDRRTVWEETPDSRQGDAFVEVSEPVRRSIAHTMPRQRLMTLLLALDPEDLAYVSDSVPEDVLGDVSGALASAERSVYEDSVQYAEDCVGHYFTREWVAVPETLSVDQCFADLRARGELPPQTDRIFVVDARNVLQGTVTLQSLIVRPPSVLLVDTLSDEIVSFTPGDDVADAAKAFERYDLVSAPVVDDRGKLIGRLTIDSIVDFVRDESSRRELQQAGLNRDEDVFGSPWDSARNRWPWLGINLITAFVASRVIGRFEPTIQQVAALAALMPIVASIGGNTGNQTMALVVRAFAMNRIEVSGTRQLLSKELIVGLLNGVVWGGIVGLAAALLYSSWALGAVMSAAVLMNLVVAALSGVAIPIALHAGGYDPAHGSSVLLTFITDAMGFFLFLGLATAVLL